jgi:transposase
MAYDKKFRQRAIEYKDAGHTFKEVNEAFGVDSKRYYSWKKPLEETGSLEKKPLKERKGKINKSELVRLAGEHPDWYLREFAEKLNVCPQAVDKMVKKLGIARKKKLLRIRKKAKKNGQST